MLGERIRYMRNELSMTMKELGEKVGLTESAIGMIERGERSTQINQIERISNALNVSPAWLVGWEGGRQMSEYQKNSKLVEFKELTKPLVEWLQRNGNPHQTIVITQIQAKLVSDVLGIPFNVSD